MADYSIKALEAELGIQNRAPSDINQAFYGGSLQKPAAASKPAFLPAVAHSVGNIVKSTAAGVAHAAVQGAQGLYGIGANAVGNMTLHQHQISLDTRNKQLQAHQSQIISAYKNRQISKDQYTKALRELQVHGEKLSKDAHAVANMHKAGYGEVAQNALHGGALVATLAAPVAEAGAGAYAGVKGAQAAAKVVDGGFGASKFIGNGKGLPGAAVATAGKLVRNAVVSQPVANMPGQIVQDVKTRNYGDLALQAGVLAAPAVAKGIGVAAKRLAPGLRDAMFGRQGFFNVISEHGGPDLVAHLDAQAEVGKSTKGIEKVLRRLQQYNLDQFGGNAQQAGVHFVETLKADGLNPAEMSPQEIIKHAEKWMQAHSTIQTAAKEGRIVDEMGNPVKLGEGEHLIASRANPTEIKVLRNRFAEANTPEQRHAIIDDMAKEGASFGKNKYVLSRLHQAADSPTWRKDLAAKNLPALHPFNITARPAIGGKAAKVAAIVDKNAPVTERTAGQKELDAALGSETAPSRPVKLPQGYGVAISRNTRATLKPLGETAAIDRGVKATKGLGAVGNGLVKLGLSPQAVNSSLIRTHLTGSLTNEMEKLGVPGKAEAVLNRLNNVNRLGVMDARNLTKNDIQAALGADYPIDKIPALQKAIKNAYANLPRELIGMGPTALNKAIKHLPGLATYLRAQNIGRYELNPIFRIKQYIKSGVVSAAEGAQVGVKASSDDIRALRNANLLSARGSSAGGDATLAGSLGSGSDEGNRLLDPVMKKMVQNLAASIAKNHDTTVADILSVDSPLKREMVQSLKLVTSYGKGGYLNSPLAKTLNLIIFPSRFETKVAMEAGKAFAKASPITQVAVASGIAHTAAFLATPQGKQWQRDNSELLGIIKYFTPLQTLDNFQKFLNNGHHIADLGELGGLPIGVFSQILDHQGVNLGALGGSQYFDPKTGEPVPTAIPQTDKARLQQGFTDFIGSMYSWPGKTVGWKSKTDMTQSVSILKPDKGSVKYELKDGSEPQTKSSTLNTPTTQRPIINRPAKVTSTPIAPIFKAKKPGTLRGPKPKIYAKRRGQGGF